MILETALDSGLALSTLAGPKPCSRAKVARQYEGSKNMNTALPKIATANAIADKELKALSAGLAPGIYTVDSTVRIYGTLKKGEPFTTRVAAAVPVWKLLAKALSKLNSATVDALVREALDGGDDEADAVKAQAERALADLVASTERTSSGRLTSQLLWEQRS
jgi:hypothetical protein